MRRPGEHAAEIRAWCVGYSNDYGGKTCATLRRQVRLLPSRVVLARMTSASPLSMRRMLTAIDGAVVFQPDLSIQSFGTFFTVSEAPNRVLLYRSGAPEEVPLTRVGRSAAPVRLPMGGGASQRGCGLRRLSGR